MFRSTAVRINQNNKIINQNSTANNLISQQSTNTRKQTEAIKEQTESISNVATQIKESNKPTVTIKLEEYNQLLNANLEYELLVDSIEKILVLERPDRLCKSFNILMSKEQINKLILVSIQKLGMHGMINSMSDLDDVEVNLIPSRNRI